MESANMESELHSVETDELEQDGMPSTVCFDEIANLLDNVLPSENESTGKRKRDNLEENSNDSDSSVEIGVCSDSGQRQDSVDSNSSSGSNGSTGLETTLSDLELGKHGAEKDKRNDSGTNQCNEKDGFIDEAKSDHDVSGVEVSAKTKVDLKAEGIDGYSGGHFGDCEGGEKQGHAGDSHNLSSTEDGELTQDEDGDTVLHIAIVCELLELTLAIISALEPCHLNIMNNMGQTALHLAVLTKQAPIIQKLIEARACPHLRDHQGRTPVLIACEKGNVSLFQTMMEQEWSCADMVLDERLDTIYPTEQCSAEKSEIFNISNSDGQCCIHLAATYTCLHDKISNSDGQCCIHLAATGLHDNISNSDGQCCIHLATRTIMLPLLELILIHGADVNLPDRKSGRTALHLATELGHTAIVELLLNQNTLKIDKRTMGDETASAIAYVTKKKDIYKLLKAKGAKEDFKYFAKFGVATAKIKKRCKTTETTNDG